MVAAPREESLALPAEPDWPRSVRWSQPFRSATPRSRNLPDWLIIGTQKGGTTSLWLELAKHPDVAASLVKEVHFFTWFFERGINWYRTFFPMSRKRRTGEATPFYLYHPRVPLRVAQALPEVRVIVLLRDPVSRAVSHYLHNVRHGLESLPMLEAFEAEPWRLRSRTTMSSSGARSVIQHWSYLDRGRYAVQLERWYEALGPERVLVIPSEVYLADHAPAMRDVTSFLELAPWIPGVPERANQNPQPVHLDDATTGLLVHEFEEPNRRLSTLLGDRSASFPWLPELRAGERPHVAPTA